MPPLQALAALQGFWAVAAAAASDWLVRNARPRLLRPAGAAAAVFGGVLFAAVAVGGTVHWLYHEGGEPRYIGQRLLYVAVTSTDLPLGQLCAAGVFCWWAARRRERAAVREPSGEGAPSGAWPIEGRERGA
jgi:hypothetical protein